MNSVKIILLGLNGIGKRVYDYLLKRNDASVLALLTEQDQLNIVAELQPELIVSAGFRHIIPEEVLAVPELGTINLHKSYLPYNRGANPNVWSIIENDPVGVSIHHVTGTVDTGPIIDRREVPTYPDDSARDLYERLEDEQIRQFADIWPNIRDGDTVTIEQDLKEGSTHRKQEFVDLWRIDRDESVTAGEFIDRLRALTFPPFQNAYFEQDGKKYYINIDISRGRLLEEHPDLPLSTYQEESDLP
jgi:methionyl-tRNA formyltransferase